MNSDQTNCPYLSTSGDKIQTNPEPVAGEIIQFRLKGVHDDFMLAEVLGNDGDGEVWLKYLDYPNHKASYPISSLAIESKSSDKWRCLASERGGCFCTGRCQYTEKEWEEIQNLKEKVRFTGVNEMKFPVGE